VTHPLNIFYNTASEYGFGIAGLHENVFLEGSQMMLFWEAQETGNIEVKNFTIQRICTILEQKQNDYKVLTKHLM
jgi:hypothetical protein